MTDQQHSAVPFLSARRRAFAVVMAIELWERFGYYGMQAVLTVFMVAQLHMQDHDVNLMQGGLGFLIYSLPVLGGILGDQCVGTRLTMLMGAFGLTAGYGLLAMSLGHQAVFLPALTLIALSNGLFKPNAGTLVRRIYAGDGTALDAAFTLYYMAINVGSTVSMLLMPWLQQRYGAAVAFLACVGGLLVGLGYYAVRGGRMRRFLVGRAAEAVQHHGPTVMPVPLMERLSNPVQKGGLGAAILLAILLVWAFCTWVLYSPALVRLCIILAGLGLVLLWVWLYVRAKESERPGLLLTYILCAQTMAYQIFYQQMQTSLTLFAMRDVSGVYQLGPYRLFTMTAGQFQALNPIAVMLFSPVLAWLYRRSARKGHDAPPAAKILCGYALVGLAFLIWWLAAGHSTGLVSPWVMVAGYGTMSLGELLTIGLGLAIVARYAPARVSAVLMGALFLLWGIGMYLGSLVADLASVPADGGGSLAGYVALFRGLFLGCVGLCVVLALLLPCTRRLGQQHRNQTVKKPATVT
ncbi:peptide MFS transporter [Bombella sp. TMW 2.2543]|uniref:Peptide MFS transporter n=1 Tax=Bombella pluederhausensis TaxID=2967336 RepID=A0ABT3WII9_9PROT|nr:peptide MFS transporter [Bombella pluederhausensis]MCX5618015.1 peptide MFS transporter [Bombella pluederhausensis]